MPRANRIIRGDQIYHIINRASGYSLLFEGAACYREFLHVVGESAEESGMRILAYCAMPNHWHMLVWPRQDRDLRRFVHKFTIQHSHRWHVRKGIVGRGALYQGRYKSCIVQTDRYLLTVCRYIERNPLRAGLVKSALAWPWSSTPHRALALGVENVWLEPSQLTGPRLALEPLPVDLPQDWARWVDEPQTDAELDRVRRHIQSGTPYGDPGWIQSMGQRPAEKPVGEEPRSARPAERPVNGTGKRYK